MIRISDKRRASLVRIKLVIRSFADKATRAVFEGRRVRKFEALLVSCKRKLDQLQAAKSLIDLSIPPANRLEALKGNREGQYSVRVNDQYRVCFRWEGEDAFEVELTDYH